MKNKLLICVSIFLMVGLIISFGHNVQAQDKLTIKLGHPGSEKELFGQGAVEFENIVEEAAQRFLEKEVDVERHPGSALSGGSDATDIEMLQQGAIEMVVTSSAKLQSIVPDIAVISLPFMFEDIDEAVKFYKSPLAQEIAALFEPKGIKLISHFPRAFRQVSNNQRPIKTLEDMEGLKFRVMNSELYVNTMDALGATGQPMSFGDVYTGIQLGTIHGQENGLDATYRSSIYEVQDYITKWYYSTDSAAVIVNLDWWESLSPEMRGLLEGAIVAVENQQKDLVKQAEAEAEKALKEAGLEITELGENERERFKEAAKTVWDDYRGEFETENLIDRVLKIINEE